MLVGIPKFSLRKTLLFSANFFLLFFLFSFSSCKKTPSLGDELLDDESKSFRVIEFNNSFSHSILDSAVKSDEDACNTSMLGSYNDPDLGILESGFMAQYALPFPNNLKISALFPDSFVVDSVCVQLPYKNYYGNSSADRNYQRLQVFELKSGISKSSNYYSNLDADAYIESTALLDRYFSPNPTEIVTTDFDTTSMLRVKLSNSLGQKILSDTDALKSTISFIEKFKGLQFRTKSSNQTNLFGSIVGFDLLKSSSKLIIYIRHQRLGPISYVFNTASDYAKVNFYKYFRNPSNAFSQQLLDTTLGQSSIYVQGFGSAKSLITFPFLQGFKDSLPVLLLKAELIFEVEDQNLDIFTPIPKLALKINNSDGTTRKLSDENATGAFNIDGYYNSALKQYKFNITQYVYSLLFSDQTDKGLLLSSFEPVLNPGKIKLKGGNKIKLKLTYTKTK